MLQERLKKHVRKTKIINHRSKFLREKFQKILNQKLG
jgi:hypothetical protein